MADPANRETLEDIVNPELIQILAPPKQGPACRMCEVLAVPGLAQALCLSLLAHPYSAPEGR